MPQVFQVLCCFNCEMFQVQFVKKSNKWQCKVCNKKQSLKKAFKIGSAPDCRSLVQELNMQKAFVKSFDDDDEWENSGSANATEPFEYGINDFRDDHLEEFVECNRSMKNKISENNNKIERHMPDSASETSIKNSTSAKDTSCISKIPQTAEAQAKKDFMVNAMIEKRELCDSIFNENRIINCRPKKRPEETSFEQSNHATNNEQSNHLPPFKKNRGFQLIKNSALKLS